MLDDAFIYRLYWTILKKKNFSVTSVKVKQDRMTNVTNVVQHATKRQTRHVPVSDQSCHQQPAGRGDEVYV